MRTDYNLDDDMEESNAAADEDTSSSNAMEDDGDTLSIDTIKKHGSTICLGIVNELEDQMKNSLEEHGTDKYKKRIERERASSCIYGKAL